MSFVFAGQTAAQLVYVAIKSQIEIQCYIFYIDMPSEVFQAMLLFKNLISS